ncbi:MAG TPA: GNAT family N-acetyltransferase [Dehalococcoidales bacterium]|nr:GNAT family N-acetyltransferase [Dehalococcoidales bacterium]
MKETDIAPSRFVVREVTDAEFTASARIIRNSFRTVAKEFGFTRENFPNHASFFTVRQLRELKDKGVRPFGLFLDGTQIGFVGIEEGEDSVYYIEKLAVLPAYRHEGGGKKLISFAIDYIRKRGGKKIGLGVMNEHKVLKDWYQNLGFREVSIHKFPNLSFVFAWMERDVSPLKGLVAG